VDLGSSYPPSDILSAILFAQLEARDWIQNKRHAIWNFYFNGLEQWAGEQTVRLPVVPEHCEHPAHMFYLVMPSPADRDRLISHLKERNILSVFHYTPLHLSEMGLRFGGRPGDCPVCEDVSARLLRLPFSNKLALPDLNRVVAAIREFPCQSA
jgi:dTDP-4-amino-4,6-dideoxygalactose transaminase